MKIETTHSIIPSPNGKSARLMVYLTIDGLPAGSVLAASGPKADIEDLVAGNITHAELQVRWKMSP